MEGLKLLYSYNAEDLFFEILDAISFNHDPIAHPPNHLQSNDLGLIDLVIEEEHRKKAQSHNDSLMAKLHYKVLVPADELEIKAFDKEYLYAKFLLFLRKFNLWTRQRSKGKKQSTFV